MEGPHSLLEVISDIGTVSTAFSHSPTAAIQVVGPGLIEINEQVDSSTRFMFPLTICIFFEMSLRASNPLAPGRPIRQCMALEEIENVDKELLAARYEAAATKEFRGLATSWASRTK